MSGGECKIKEPPPHVILGKTQVDQDWIDGEVEVGVGVCGFPRPGPRPAALDALPATRQAPVAADPVRAAPVKRKGFIRRFRDRIHTPPPAAVTQLPAPIPYVTTPPPDPPPAPAPARPRRDPVMDFLHPKG